MRNGYVSDESEKVNIEVTKKNKKSLIKFFIWLAICLFVYFQVYELVAYTLGKKTKESMWLYNGINKVITTIAPKAKETTQDNTLKLAALGDIYASSNILKGAKTGNTYDFSKAFTQTKTLLSNYDVVLASLNTPVTDSSYSTKTVYNSPKELLETIKSLGISVLATAGNHSIDKGEAGIKSTIDELKTSQINQVGLSISTDRTKPYIIDKNNIKIGVLSYMTKSKVQISKGKEYLVNALTDDNIKADMEYLKSQNVDYIISYLNTPNEDGSRVTSDQKNNVEKLFENGVNIVLCTGSKVVQGKTEDLYELSDGTKNHVYAIYSLGDFIGEMDTDARKTSLGADITFTKSITKDKKGNVITDKTKKNMVINEPLSFYTSVTSSYSTTNYPMVETLDLYNQDKIDLNAKDYNAMKTAQSDITTILK